MTRYVNEGIAYQVGCFIILPTYLLTKPYNFTTIKNNVAMTQLKVLQMDLIYLFKPHQSSDVIVCATHSLNFLTIIRLQTRAIPLAQLAKNIY
jgi:ABC-type uncharacterized transport system substrate-binding protein